MLVQLSDLHLRPGDSGPEERLRRALALVAAMDPAPDAMLISGDIADVPEPEVYARAREMLDEARLPVMAIPGNHDDRDLLVAAFGAVPVAGRAGPMRVLGLDTSRPAAPTAGWRTTTWSGSRRSWPRTPTRRRSWPCTTRPCSPGSGPWTPSGWGPPIALRSRCSLGRHPQVRTVTCGHVHRTMATALGGAAVVIAPGVSSQLRLDLRPQDDLPIEMTAEPPGLAVHLLVDGGIRSHFQRVADG